MSKGTRPRSLRIPAPLWEAALATARADGTTLTAVVVTFLRRYTNGGRR